MAQQEFNCCHRYQNFDRGPKMFNPHNPMSLPESREAMQNFRELQHIGTTGDPMDRLRLVCLSHGPTGILSLGRMFRHMDEDGKIHLNEDEFLHGLQNTGMDIIEEEADDLFDKYDTDDSGGVNMDAFMKAIRLPLSQSRKMMIEKAFDKMDRTGDGEITIDDLKNVYNVQYHPLFRSGEKSEETIFNRFLANFDKGAAEDGHVTREEFFNFYAAISASIDTDVFFDLMMRQCYNL